MNQRPRAPIYSWGEILWDLFPDGAKLGGAPANVAFHLAALGADSRLVSRVGDDRRGREAIATLARRGVDTSMIEIDNERPTGSVSVSVDAGGEASYTLNRGGAWEHIVPASEHRARLADARAICFGTFSQRNPPARTALATALASVPATCMRVCDPNLRKTGIDPAVLRWSLENADIVKINDREAEWIEEALEVPDATAWLLGGRCRLVALTRGARGSRLVTDDGESDHEGYPAAPGGDTVGAGDAFTAVLVHELSRSLRDTLTVSELDAVNEIANRYSCFVAGKRGATPSPPADLIALANH